MKALVTGAGGFIGSHLVGHLFQKGFFVRALEQETKRHAAWPVGAEVMAGDVRKPQAMKAAAAGCEIVYHLAGKAHALSEVRGDEDVYRAINMDGTRHVVEGAVAGGAKAFVLFSSAKATGEWGSRCVDESFN